jgi:acetylglutamate kinase
MILNIFKIGGSVVDNSALLEEFADKLAAWPGLKLVVHGGGQSASSMCEKLGIPVRMQDGRRITDKAALKVMVMIYGGWVNKSVVTSLQSRNINAIGLSGADGNAIRAHKRTGTEIDYGYAGDIDEVNGVYLSELLTAGLTPVLAPLTHDGNGQLLNTNADTIAAEVAAAMADSYDTTLTYVLDLPGVLRDVKDVNSVIPTISVAAIAGLKEQGAVAGGMIPKLHNASQAILGGVKEVVITDLASLSAKGTVLCTRITA